MANTFTDATLTIDDLQGDIAGSTFTNCTFNETAEDEIITKVNFALCEFNDCTWNTTVEQCNFKGAEGNSIPTITKVVFDSPPPFGAIARDNDGCLFHGNGETTEFYFKRTSQSDIDAVISRVVPGIEYTTTLGKMGPLCGSGGCIKTRSEFLGECSLELSTDATDSASPVNGVPDIEANGTSTCTITIKKKDREGTYKTSSGDDDTIKLENTRGRLSALEVDLVNGEASVTLTSAAETCVSTITASSGDLGSTTIDIQFAPPQE